VIPIKQTNHFDNPALPREPNYQTKVLLVVVCTDITLLIKVSSSQLVQTGSKPLKKASPLHSPGRESVILLRTNQ